MVSARGWSSGVRVGQILVQDLRLRTWGSGFRVQNLAFRVQELGLRVHVSGFMFQGSGFSVQGLAFRVQGWWCRALPCHPCVSDSRKIDLRIPGKGDSASHGARPVH